MTSFCRKSNFWGGVPYEGKLFWKGRAFFFSDGCDGLHFDLN